MPIDTSSYYPEVNDPNNDSSGNSLNSRNISLFGSEGKSPEFSDESSEVPSPTPPPPANNEKEYGVDKFVTFCSNLISWALVPLLMPVYGIILVFCLSVLDVVSPGLRMAFTFIIFGINFCIPMLFLLLLKFLGIIHDPGLNDRQERLIPYIITAFCMGGTAWFLSSRGAPLWLDMFYLGGATASLINLIINFKWKISAHAAGIAGLIALLIRLEKDVAVEPQLFVWLLIVIGAAGLVGSARIWLGRHTVWQVLAGYAVGFCSVFFLMSI